MQRPRTAGAVAVIPAEGEGTGHDPGWAILPRQFPRPLSTPFVPDRHSTQVSPALNPPGSWEEGAGQDFSAGLNDLESLFHPE